MSHNNMKGDVIVCAMTSIITFKCGATATCQSQALLCLERGSRRMELLSLYITLVVKKEENKTYTITNGN